MTVKLYTFSAYENAWGNGMHLSGRQLLLHALVINRGESMNVSNWEYVA